MRALHNNLGQALSEVLAAMAILGISIFAVTSFMLNQSQLDGRINGVASCRSYVQAVLNDFTDASSVVTTNYIPGAAGAARVPALLASRVEQNYYAANAYGQIRNFQNIENAMTRAYQIYMGNTAYCTAFQPLTANVLSNPNILTALTNARFTANIKIEPFNLLLNQPIATGSCGTPPDIRPVGGANGGNTPTPNPSNFGLLVTVNVLGGQGQQCTGYKLLTYSPDTVAPNMAAIDAPWPANLSSCAGGNYFAQLASSEPGSVFSCTWDGGAPVACQSLAIGGGVTVTLTPQNQGTGQVDTQAILQLSNVPTAAYSHTLRVLAHDAASNVPGALQQIDINCDCTNTPTCSGNQPITVLSNCNGPPDATWTPMGVRSWMQNRVAVCNCFPNSAVYSAAPAADTGDPQCTVAQQTCAVDGSGYGAWTCTGCNAGFSLVAGTCNAVACVNGTTQACVGGDANANYSQTCAAGVWGACGCVGCKRTFTGTCGTCAAAPGVWKCSAAAGTNNWCDLSKTGNACGPIGSTTVDGGGAFTSTTWPFNRSAIDLTCDTMANCLASPTTCQPK